LENVVDKLHILFDNSSVATNSARVGVEELVEKVPMSFALRRESFGVAIALRSFTAIAAVLVALTIAPQARASTFISFYLNQPECDINGCTSLPALIPDSLAVKVSVTLVDSTHATVEFIAPGSPGPTTVETPVFLNVSGILDSSTSTTLGGGFAFINGGGGGDHFGSMNLATSAVHSPDFFIYLVAGTGNSWADAESVLTPSTPTSAVYPHGFEAELEGSAIQYAGYYVPSAVPAPAALPLFATGLGLLGALGRRRKRKVAA
jgi:hypothetical protein